MGVILPSTYIQVIYELHSNLTAIQKHEKAAHWRSHPFPLYDNMAELLDGVIPTGAHAFSSEFGPTPDDEAADEESLPGNLDPALFEKELSTDGEKDDDKVSGLKSIDFPSCNEVFSGPFGGACTRHP